MFHGQFEAIFGMDDPTVNLLEWHRRTQPLVRALQDRWTAQEQPGYVGISDIIYEIYLANFPALPKKRRVLSENIYLFQKEV